MEQGKEYNFLDPDSIVFMLSENFQSLAFSAGFLCTVTAERKGTYLNHSRYKQLKTR